MTEPSTCADLMKRYYPPPHVDALDAVFTECANPGMKVLDAGCSDARGCTRNSPWEQMYIVGIDYEPSVKNNPFCNDALVGDLTTLPFEDDTFDIIHCRWVLEHIADPLITFREFRRILKPGGAFLALTPNLFHYASLGAQFSPHWFHRWWWREEYDPFPTYFRSNSRRRVRRLCKQSGFTLEKLQSIEGPPNYLRRYRLGFHCGIIYERFVNSTALFSWLRHDLVFKAVATQ